VITVSALGPLEKRTIHDQDPQRTTGVVMLTDAVENTIAGWQAR
jgi:hypothetical protein